MATIKTLSELKAAYDSGRVVGPLMIDNDDIFVYQDDEFVFEMHPEDLLEQALVLLRDRGLLGELRSRVSRARRDGAGAHQ